MDHFNPVLDSFWVALNEDDFACLICKADRKGKYHFKFRTALAHYHSSHPLDGGNTNLHMRQRQALERSKRLGRRMASASSQSSTSAQLPSSSFSCGVQAVSASTDEDTYDQARTNTGAGAATPFPSVPLPTRARRKPSERHRTDESDLEGSSEEALVVAQDLDESSEVARVADEDNQDLEESSDEYGVGDEDKDWSAGDCCTDPDTDMLNGEAQPSAPLSKSVMKTRRRTMVNVPRLAENHVALVDLRTRLSIMCPQESTVSKDIGSIARMAAVLLDEDCECTTGNQLVQAMLTAPEDKLLLLLQSLTEDSNWGHILNTLSALVKVSKRRH